MEGSDPVPAATPPAIPRVNSGFLVARGRRPPWGKGMKSVAGRSECARASHGGEEAVLGPRVVERLAKQTPRLRAVLVLPPPPHRRPLAASVIRKRQNRHSANTSDRTVYLPVLAS